MAEQLNVEIRCKTSVLFQDGNIVLVKISAGAAGDESAWVSQYLLVRRDGVKAEIETVDG